MIKFLNTTFKQEKLGDGTPVANAVNQIWNQQDINPNLPPQDLPPTFLDAPVQEEDVVYFIDNFIANPENALKINNLKHAYDPQYSKEDSINLLKASTIVSSVVLKFLNNWTLAKQVLKQYLIATRGELLANGYSVGDAVEVLWKE